MIRLVRTCEACPEQYDAYKGEERVAYLRLRHGLFTVDTWPAGMRIYAATPDGDGAFLATERDYYLRFAVQAIEHISDDLNYPPPPKVAYKIETPDKEEIEIQPYAGEEPQ